MRSTLPVYPQSRHVNSLSGTVNSSAAPSAGVPAAAMGKNSSRHSGTTPEYSPTLSVTASTRVNRRACASWETMSIMPFAMASSCIRRAHLSRQLKHGSMLAMMSPASATVLPRSMNGTVGVFL